MENVNCYTARFKGMCYCLSAGIALRNGHGGRGVVLGDTRNFHRTIAISPADPPQEIEDGIVFRASARPRSGGISSDAARQLVRAQDPCGALVKIETGGYQLLYREGVVHGSAVMCGKPALLGQGLVRANGGSGTGAIALSFEQLWFMPPGSSLGVRTYDERRLKISAAAEGSVALSPLSEGERLSIDLSEMYGREIGNMREQMRAGRGKENRNGACGALLRLAREYRADGQLNCLWDEIAEYFRAHEDDIDVHVLQAMLRYCPDNHPFFRETAPGLIAALFGPQHAKGAPKGATE